MAVLRADMILGVISGRTAIHTTDQARNLVGHGMHRHLKVVAMIGRILGFGDHNIF